MYVYIYNISRRNSSLSTCGKRDGFFPTKDMQTSPPPPSPSEVAIFTWKMRAVLLFFYFFESWLIVFTIYGDTLGVPPTKKKVVQKLPNLQEICELLRKWSTNFFLLAIWIKCFLTNVFQKSSYLHERYGMC